MLTRSPDPTPAVELEQLAGMVRGLRPDWRDAEAFYEARSEVVAGLMRLSRRLAGRAMPAPLPTPLRRPIPAVRQRGYAAVAGFGITYGVDGDVYTGWAGGASPSSEGGARPFHSAVVHAIAIH